MSVSDQMDTGHDTDLDRRGPLLLIAGFVVLAVIIVIVAVVAWREQAQAMRATTDDSLVAVAALRSNQTSAWAAERHADAQVIRHDTLLATTVGDWLSGDGTAATKTDIAGRLASIQQAYDYVDVALVRPDDAVELHRPEGASFALDAAGQALLAKAVRTGQVESTDLYLDTAGRPRLDVIAPVPGGRPGDAAVAAIVLRIDPARFLYPPGGMI